ncbi:MAG: hypothetical protein EP319_07830 [Deltaproteobacteria bacterium]|nr:MAG: hypothetical protein EP319_07830 [Deltaproteobacteria bacterium]
MSELSKEELMLQMNEKNRELLVNSDGIGSLFVYNLENFAGRYLETSQDREIKCQFDGTNYWVESIEPNILEALKWQNLELKEKLIGLCKKFPGHQSKEIKTKLQLTSKMLSENKVECTSNIFISTPIENENLSLSKKTQMTFDDPIELRNKHALLLEEVCEIF